ncbi:MAG: rod shape-determining protein MreB, partial [Lentisphaeria bacterium]|nr:rod shape-determining protein MreB [Lentisphaeria bacterium]
MFSTYIGLDLGTANCLVYVGDQGIVLAEPSVVAVRVNQAQLSVIAVGSEAKEMLGKTPGNIRAIRPMKDGVIANFQITEEMLRHFIKKGMRQVPWYRRILAPILVIAVPSGITEVEKRAVEDSAKRAGAGEVLLVEEPMAAAIGVGLPVADPAGSMIVDIGGGTTEVAVLSLTGIVSARSVRVGGDELDDAIMNHLRKVHNLLIGELTAERIKIKLGSAYPVKDDEELDVKGLDQLSRIPKTVRITASEIRIALQEPVTSILEAVIGTLDDCPPDLAADLIDRGIMLAGGGAMLAGLDKLLTEETGLPVFIADNPLNAVVNGSFYYNNKILVKRVIAFPGDWIDLDNEGNVKVNGQLLDEPYLVDKAYGDVNIELPYQV